jgi:D-galactarolactone cycloisomerase
VRITAVEAVPLSIPFQYGAEGWKLGSGGWKALDFCLVRVETDAGLVGWGEAFSYSCRGAVTAAVRDMIAPIAVGKRAAEIDAIHSEIQQRLHIFGRFGITAFALSGLDIALWDLAGKSAGKPLHALIGGARRQRIPTYASLLRYAESRLLAQYCQRAIDEGHLAAAPRDVPLLLDVNCEWTVAEAIAMAKRLAPLGLEWLEEPVFPPEDAMGLRAVGEACGIPIAAGENCCFVTQFAALLDGVQYAQPSVTKVGGVTEFLKVAALARERGVKLAPHSPYFGPGALATLHLHAALTDEARFEYFYLRAEAGLYGSVLQPKAGELALPQAPGLGADPDPEVIRRYSG